MLPEGFARGDGMLVLHVMAQLGSISTAEAASGRVSTPGVLDALKRMERPEDFWDILYQLADDRILEIARQPRGEVRFTMVDVQEHDVRVFLHQNRLELEGLQVLTEDEGELTSVYMERLEEARSRAVFL